MAEISRISSTNDPNKSGTLFFWTGLCALLLLLLCPSLFFLSLLGFVAGFSSLEFINRKILLAHYGSPQERHYDPLLHRVEDIFPYCSVCPNINCQRDFHVESFRRKGSSPISLSSNRDLVVESELDAAIARFFDAVFEIYVSPSWAPYETRLELKRVLVKVLVAFGLRIKETIFVDEESIRAFICCKIFPLLVGHTKAWAKEELNLTPKEEAEAQERVLHLTHLLLNFLSPENAKCKVWTNICLSILGQGVFWNLILLGRKELPPLIVRKLKNYGGSSRDTSWKQGSSSVLASYSDSNSSAVSFLLDSFLDPAHDVEQPSLIPSRHRPTLNYILKESDMLYSLIQFLKVEGGLEWLQAVLDAESNEKNETSIPRKVIQLKHLTHFSRSRIFLENIGFSRVEAGLEVDAEDVKSKSSSHHHTRSSSYGGLSGVGLWEQKVVDGLAVYPLLNQEPLIVLPLDKNPAAFPSPTEVESLFRRKHALEPIINIFYASLQPKNEDATMEEVRMRARVGVQSKNSLSNSPTHHLIIHQCEIIDELRDTVCSLMRPDSIWPGIVFGWSRFLGPLLRESLLEMVHKQLRNLFSLNQIVSFVHLITNTLTGTGTSAKQTLEGGEIGSPVTWSTLFSSEWCLDTLFEKEELARKVASSGHRILLFFVDLLDVLVYSLVPQRAKPSD